MFTLTIFFIVLNVSVEFVLIYRPHPVDARNGGAYVQFLEASNQYSICMLCTTVCSIEKKKLRNM
jgi:hypothetical protein